ncbi:hypothetical protein V490_04079 [Pseudogymnoascus sp. VKM F-3557]|nr:hypothetical protein V490_04079 [Pseudogymnoascus sp. VKM F-3557]
MMTNPTSVGGPLVVLVNSCNISPEPSQISLSTEACGAANYGVDYGGVTDKSLLVATKENKTTRRNKRRATSYEYIVVGSGAGGGVLAARLALAGRSVLLIEAGDDQGTNDNYTIPAFNAKSTEDSSMAWDFFVRHYEDDARQAKDFKLTYTTPDGNDYTGLYPPHWRRHQGRSLSPYGNSRRMHRSQCHGGNIPPPGRFSYFAKLEKNEYLQSLLSPGHGRSGWLGIDLTPVTLALQDLKLLSMLQGGITALSGLAGTVLNLATFLAGDANADSPHRDSTQAIYQVPLASRNGARNGVRDFLVSVNNAVNADGSKKYKLEIRTHCLATKVNFDTSNPPKATGVSFLDGQSLYRADPRSGKAQAGTPGSATASREVIISGGAYNSPQLLKLSGIGPAAELKKFGIPVVKDLPGVGANLQDHYEVAVQGTTPTDFAVLKGCTFAASKSDPCLEKWHEGKLALTRGTYVSNGFVAAMFIKSSQSPDGNYDELAFGGPLNFRGYYPGYSIDATAAKNVWTWALLKAHPRNTAGSVKLASADPRDPPKILFNYFDTGSGDYAADLETITESIRIARWAIGNQSVPVTEVLPGSSIKTTEEIQDYIKNTAWGHHASCTCPIGADGDPMAVLDSSFRVRGVSGLRVVDASVYPRIPGTFTLLSTYIVGEKAADIILGGL